MIEYCDKNKFAALSLSINPNHAALGGWRPAQSSIATASARDEVIDLAEYISRVRSD
jgi:hypothetical protein